MTKPREKKGVAIKLRPPPDLVEPLRKQAEAEGTTPRVIVERAVIAFIQAGCPSLMPRLERKADLDRRSTPREQRIAMAVRRALGESRGCPRKHPLPLDEQAEVERRVAEWHRLNPPKPPPLYVALYETDGKPKIPKRTRKQDIAHDFSEVSEHEFTIDEEDVMKKA